MVPHGRAGNATGSVAPQPSCSLEAEAVLTLPLSSCDGSSAAPFTAAPDVGAAQARLSQKRWLKERQNPVGTTHGSGLITSSDVNKILLLESQSLSHSPELPERPLPSGTLVPPRNVQAAP